MNPAFAQTIPYAGQIYIRQHRKLKDNLEYLSNQLLESKAYSFNKDYHINYPGHENSAETFATNKIIITNFKYPTATEDLNRIVITANHRKEDLDKIIHLLNHN
jgi:7-keto-8-aminopelargonate synthetase-like enzyme